MFQKIKKLPKMPRLIKHKKELTKSEEAWLEAFYQWAKFMKALDEAINQKDEK